MKKMTLRLNGNRITAWLIDSIEEYMNSPSFDPDSSQYDEDCLPTHDPYNAGQAYDVHHSDDLYNVYFVDFSNGTDITLCTRVDFSDQYDEEGNFIP